MVCLHMYALLCQHAGLKRRAEVMTTMQMSLLLKQQGDAQVPLFPGDSELQQLLHIFKLLGTPTEAEWAGVSKLRDWHEFPNWRKQDLNKHFPTLGADGIDLMERMFSYTPSQRITVSKSIQRCHTQAILPRMAFGLAAEPAFITAWDWVLYSYQCMAYLEIARIACLCTRVRTQKLAESLLKRLGLKTSLWLHVLLNLSVLWLDLAK